MLLVYFMFSNRKVIKFTDTVSTVIFTIFNATRTIWHIFREKAAYFDLFNARNRHCGAREKKMYPLFPLDHNEYRSACINDVLTCAYDFSVTRLLSERAHAPPSSSFTMRNGYGKLFGSETDHSDTNSERRFAASKSSLETIF